MAYNVAIDDLSAVDFVENLLYLRDPADTVGSSFKFAHVAPIRAVRRALNYTSLRALGQFTQLDVNDVFFHVDAAYLAALPLKAGDVWYDDHGEHMVHIISTDANQRGKQLVVARKQRHAAHAHWYNFDGAGTPLTNGATTLASISDANRAGYGSLESGTDYDDYATEPLVGAAAFDFVNPATGSLTIQTANAKDAANLTIAFQIHPRSWGGSNEATILAEGTGWLLKFSFATPGRLEFTQATDSGNGVWQSDASLTLDQTQHVAVVVPTRSAGTAPTFYVDGVAVGTTEINPQSGSLVGDTGQVAVGRAWLSASYALDAVLDDLRFYTSASLTLPEIQALAALPALRV